MTEEHDLIPFSSTPLLGERLLVVAPHPDDEIIGCGGVLAQHVRDGRSVRIVIVTDGAAAETTGEDLAAYRLRRQEESRRGLALLGAPEPRFLGIADRAAAENLDALSGQLSQEIADFRPDLILVPSPIELHPDHVAIARALVELLQRDAELAATLAVTRVAFYEVSRPLAPNILVDITAVAAAKFEAIRAHESQTSVRDYASFAEGLNKYRALTLEASSLYAEGYWVTPAGALRTMPLTELERAVSGTSIVEVVEGALPISVVIRTKNRPVLLREALQSIVGSGYPCEVVVVNDGGASPAEAIAGTGAQVRLVEHAESRGRSAAANAGAAAATHAFLTFLDDDDLHYPEHLPVLARAARSSTHVAHYTDAVSSFLRTGEDGSWSVRDRLRLFARDFDRELLLVDNYIPLPTLLMRRELFLELGGFDPAFDLFEDWDFLIRLSQRGSFLRVPRVTCEIRQFQGGDSITQSAPEGSAAFRAAKRQVWEKNTELIGNDTILDVFEREKRRAAGVESRLLDTTGRASHLERDVYRLEREKASLLRDLQQQHEVTNQQAMRISELHGALGAVERMAAEHAQVAIENARAGETHARRAAELEATLASATGQHTSAVTALYAEIHRLQNIINAIYQSRSWKLHMLVERMKGRA
jgi:LmbE family N-acetylglucosaminyl deacetylase